MINPFEGLTPLETRKITQLLEIQTLTYNKNQEIIKTFKNEKIIGIILEGYAQIIRINYNGNKNIIEELVKYSVFDTNTISNIDNDFEIIAKDITKIIIIDYKTLINIQNINKVYYNKFLRNLFIIINKKTQEKNNRIKILTQKTIRNKLLEFFLIERTKSHSKNIYLKSTFSDLADFLAIDRSAMTRELKYLKEEGFIEIKGKKITLLY